MEICRKEDFSVIDEQSNIEKEQADLYVEESREMDDIDAEQIYTGKNVAVDDEVLVIPMAADKVEWIADRLSESGALVIVYYSNCCSYRCTYSNCRKESYEGI